MSAPEYPDAILEYVQAQGWMTSLTELQEGTYLIAGKREQDAGTEKMLLMTVCDPEDKVRSEHIEYLFKHGKKQSVDSVLLTYTVGITDNAREIIKEYNVGVVDPQKARSHSERAEFEDDTNHTWIQYTKRAVPLFMILALVLIVLFAPNGVPIVTDNDSLSVYNEFASGTSPIAVDTDGDGLSDKIELRGPSDPTVADTDYDDLNDSKEITKYGTDPTEWDTDGDGIADGTEVKRNGELLPGADPLRKNIYIEIDYMESYRLPDREKQQIIQMFASSPVENPDGSTGIDLHIKRSNKVRSQPSTTPDDYRRIRKQNADNPGKGYFYVVLVNDVKLPQRDGDGRESYAGAGTYGMMYLRGDLPDGQMGSVFTHEMGHMLGLTPNRYRGIDSTEVPYQQYESVMNYNAPQNRYMYAGKESSFNDWEYIENRMMSPRINNTDAAV